MNLTAHDTIKSLIHTEKSSLQEPDGKYLFLVAMKANKIQIRQAVEQLYKVKVSSVNTMVSLGKMKRVRHQIGKSPDSKKAIVTLKKGFKIETA
ncbi:50S ribosomal protein L23 [bacterium]|nr:MAG: 50S ribosomal protein L23 [bacterium]